MVGGGSFRGQRNISLHYDRLVGGLLEAEPGGGELFREHSQKLVLDLLITRNFEKVLYFTPKT